MTVNTANLISVVVATYNRCEDLKGLLQSLAAQRPAVPFEYEVLIIDNNSSDGTRSVLEAAEGLFHGRLKCLFEPRQGKSFAINRGIAEARGEIIVLTDDDCLLEVDHLAKVGEAFRKSGPAVGFIGGPLIPRWVDCRQPDWFDRLEPAWLKQFFWGPLAILDYGEHPFVIDRRQVDSPEKKLFYGANLAVRKACLLTHGGLDERKAVTEDTELQLRLLKRRIEGLYAPHIKVRHKVTADRLTARYYYRWYFRRGLYREISREEYGGKFYQPWGIRPAFILRTLRMLAASLAPALSWTQRTHDRCEAIFNVGKIVQIARQRRQTTITVVIPTRNRAESLRETLKALRDQWRPRELDFEVVVVDNQSTDATRRVVRSFVSPLGPKVRYLYEPRPGRSYALNRGIENAAGDIIACLDDDCLVGPDYVFQIHDALRVTSERIGFLGGRILPYWQGGGPPPWLTEFLPGRRDAAGPAWIDEFFCGPLGILDYGETPFVLEPKEDGSYPRLFYGANLVFRKAVLERFGHFDPDSVLVEDVEICRRLLKAGVMAMYTPSVTVYHKIPVEKATPDHYYQWYFLKGLRREIVAPVDDGFRATALERFARSFGTPRMKHKLLDRCQGLFDFGQMIRAESPESPDGPP